MLWVLRPLPVPWARRRPCCSGPGGSDLRSFQILASRGYGHRPIPTSFRAATHPHPPPELARPAMHGASFGTARGSPSCSRSTGLHPMISSSTRVPTAWDCLELARAKALHLLLAAATLAGVVTFLKALSWPFCAPLRASGETLGLGFRIGRRRRLDVVLLLEGVVLVARGVLGAGFGVLVV
jgi:hypothetical protein